MGKKVLIILAIVILGMTSVNASVIWSPTPGPVSVVTNSLYTAGNVIVAGTYLTGVYVSRDYGVSWTESNEGIIRDIDSLYYIYSFTAKDNILYAATSTGMYKSYNTGQSWTPVNSRVFASISACGNYLFASDFTDVYKSSDGGVTWDLTGLINISYLTSNDEYLFAAEANSNNVFRTTDFGTSWAMISGIFAPESFVSKLYFDGERLFAIGSNAAYVSANLGNNWTTCAGLPEDGYTATGIVYSDGVHYMSHENEIYKSEDGGLTWDAVQGQLRFLTHRCLGTVGGILFLGNSNSIYKSPDGGNTWALSTNGFPKITPVISVSGNYLYAGTTMRTPYGGIWYSSSGGSSWTPGGDYPVLSVYSKGNYVLAGVTGQGIVRSTDYGMTWSPTNINWGNASGFFVDGDTVFACPNRTSGHPGGSVMKSVDGGLTFSAVSPDWKSYNMGITMTMRNVFVINTTGLYRSSDYGTTWGKIENFLYPVYLTSYGPGIYTVDKFGKMWYSLSLGYVWTSMNGEGLQGEVITKIAVSQSTVIATDGYKILRSDDRGQRWTNIGYGLPNPTGLPLISDITIDNNYAYAGLFNGGVWKAALWPTNAGNQNGIVEDFSLGQNYPNPFNPKTTISYSVPKEGSVTLNVYDVTGKLAATMVNRYHKAGIYETVFDGTDYASGVYFYKIEASGFVQVKKMVLAK